MRSVHETRSGVIVDEVPITILTNDEYRMNKNVPGNIVIILDGFLRIRRAGGSAMMQIPITAPGGATFESVRSAMSSWFAGQVGHITDTEHLENAVRFAARGAPNG